MVLGGVFTKGALAQLSSHGFSLVYCPYQVVVDAFATVGLDAAYDEATADATAQAKVDSLSRLTDAQREVIVEDLRHRVADDLRSFARELRESLGRRVSRISIAALHGGTIEVSTVESAVAFVMSYGEKQAVEGFVKYEVSVTYSNNDVIRGQFAERGGAVAFLNTVR